MLTAVGRYFIVLIDKRGHTNAPFTRSACDDRLCAKIARYELHTNGHCVRCRRTTAYYANQSNVPYMSKLSSMLRALKALILATVR